MSRCKRKETACVCGMIAIAGGTHTQVKSVGNSNREVKQKKVVAKSRRIYIYIRRSNKSYTITTAKKGRCRRIGNSTNPSCALGGPNISLSFFLLCVWERWRKRSHSPNRQKEERRKTRFLWHKQKCLLSLRCVCYFSRRWPIPTRRKWNLRKQQ